MLRLMPRLLGFAVAVVLPTVALAQRPETPNERASERAQAMVALHRATHRRGSVVRVPSDRNSNSAMSAPASRGSPFGDGPDDASQPVAPSPSPTSALPPAPARKSGPSINHRP